MSTPTFRPITDVMILARSKTKYYGAYPAGFLHRARALLGVGPNDAVLHICAGMIRQYPFRGLGKNDKTLDLAPATKPDFLRDANDPLPFNVQECGPDHCAHGGHQIPHPWAAVLIDRPYTGEDAAHYAPGPDFLPDINDLTKRALQIVPMGHCVGVLDYLWPHPGKFGREVAVMGVGTGRNGRARWFTVFERIV